MRCLVAVDVPAIRDAVGSAARAFSGVEVDAVDVEKGRSLLRRRRYDFGFLTLDSRTEDCEVIWEEFHQTSPDLPLVALTPSSALSVRRGDRSRLKLFALLGTPPDAVELYGTLRRLIERIKKSRPGPCAAPPGAPA
ncbi:MAG: hypothetical protein HY812_16340 [Planctomycetes bacterium]|nr:hypothetical protein [Planctomycetota bacterium]